MWEVQLFYWVGFVVVTLLGGCGLILFLSWLLTIFSEWADEQIGKSLTYLKAFYYANTSRMIKNRRGNSLNYENEDYKIKMEWEKKEEGENSNPETE